MPECYQGNNTAEASGRHRPKCYHDNNSDRRQRRGLEGNLGGVKMGDKRRGPVTCSHVYQDAVARP